MPLRFFTIPHRDPGSGETELNGFLGSHRVLAVDRRWVDAGENSFWAICVDYLSPGTPTRQRGGNGQSQRNQVDYRELLSAEQFAIFAKLREFRKRLAAEESVPVYLVFTNDQLADIAKMPTVTAADLKKIQGVGEARLEKYGPKVLAFLAAETNGDSKSSASAQAGN